MRHHFRGPRAAILLVLAVALFWNGPALGQTDVIDLVLATESNCVGCTPTRCLETSVPFEQITLHLIVRNPSLGGVSGWEGVVEYTGSLTAPSWSLAAGLDVDSANDTDNHERFQVGIGEAPLALMPNAAGNVVLATFSAFVLSPLDDVRFFVGPIPGTTIYPGFGAYASPVDAGNIAPLLPPLGDWDIPVFSINDPDCGAPSAVPFSVTITASNGITMDAGNVLGTHAEAVDGQDDLDIPSAPTPPADFVQASFPHPEWLSPFGPNFDHDIRATFDQTQEGRTWIMQVGTDMLDEPITLDFTVTSGSVPILDLRDHDTGAVIHLNDTGMQYTYLPNPSGWNTFDVLVGATGLPPVVPALREMDTGWNLIGMPLVPNDASLGAVVLDDASGLVYAIKHDQVVGYRTVPESELLSQGRGYWIGASSPFVWRMTGERDTGAISIPLDAGWNMIGYPLWFPSHVNGITVQHAGSDYAWGDAVGAGLVDGSLYDYNGSTYVPTTDLAAWHGYWLAALTDGVTLRFRWDEMPTTAQRPWDPFADLSDPDNWRLEVSAEGAGQSVVLGVCERSSDGFDAYQDRPRAPAAPTDAGGPSLWFPRPEWNLPTGEKARGDVRAPSPARLQEWTAKLAAPEPGPVTLTWDRETWGGTADLELYLPQRHRVAVPSLRAVGSVTLAVGEEPLDLVFRSPRTSTGVESPAAAVGRLRAVPNPFNPRTEIRFTSAAGGRCTVRIYDVAGRCVRSLDAGQVPAGGEGAVVWRGRDDAGRELASGAYFARLQNEDGSQEAAARLSLVR